LRELALFAGAGGGILGGALLGWRTVCAVEFNPYAAAVLVARQNDGVLPPFPIWDDVQTFDGRPWRGAVDVVSGGFPCQDISTAGASAGIDGARSRLWGEMARIVGEVRPRFVLVENSPALTARGLDQVLGDLAALGYDAEWGVLGAWHVGADHQRDRIWIAAYADDAGERPVPVDAEVAASPQSCSGDAAHADGAQREGNRRAVRVSTERADARVNRWWDAEPGMDRVAHGLAHRMDRLRCTGNGQVPAVVALAWRTLLGRAGFDV